LELLHTAIFVQAQTANIFSRLFTFETARLQFQLNGALAVGNVIVIEVQTRLLFWA
jgi:hypothetical protein